MKKLSLIYLSLLLLAACKKDITNIDPKSPQYAPAAALFTNAQRTLDSIITTPNVNSNVFRLITQQWTQTTYTDESNYNLSTRNIPHFVWRTLYRDVLRDFQETKRLITQQQLDTVVAANQTAITDVMEVYTWYYLVTTYGDIPYSE